MTKTKFKQLILVIKTIFVARRVVLEMNDSGIEAERPKNYSQYPFKRTQRDFNVNKSKRIIIVKQPKIIVIFIIIDVKSASA